MNSTNYKVVSKVKTYITIHLPAIKTILRTMALTLTFLIAVGGLVNVSKGKAQLSTPLAPYVDETESVGGIVWTDVISGLTNLNCRTMALNPVTPSILFVATQRGDFRSTDGGDNWELIRSRGPYYTSGEQFALDITNPSTVYLADSSEGILKSVNNGDSWTSINGTLSSYYGAHAIAVSPISPSLIFVGFSQYQWGGYKTSDGGLHWEKIADLPDDSVEQFVFEPGNPYRVYAASWQGVYVSTDGGETWHSSSTGIGPNSAVYSIAVSPVSPTVVYIGTSRYVYRSTDRAASWTKVHTFPYGLRPLVQIDPLDPGTLYVSGYREILATYDYGVHWSRLLSTSRSSAYGLVLDRRSDTQGWLYACGWYWGVKKGTLLLNHVYLPLIVRQQEPSYQSKGG